MDAIDDKAIWVATLPSTHTVPSGEVVDEDYGDVLEVAPGVFETAQVRQRVRGQFFRRLRRVQRSRG